MNSVSKIPGWSPRGIYYPFQGRGPAEFQHVTVEPCTDAMAACNSCGRPNYRRVMRGGFDGTDVSADFEPNGLKLVVLSICPNGFQASETRLCPECATVAGGKLTAVAEALGARWEDVVRGYAEEGGGVDG